MRLIDADELIFFPIKYGYNYEAEIIPKYLIDRAETIDAEPVIRCKDCKYWKEHKLTGRRFCELVTTPTISYWLSRADDYCSRGERKEDEQA